MDGVGKDKFSSAPSALATAFADDSATLRAMLEEGAQKPHWFIQQYLALNSSSVAEAKSRFRAMIDSAATVAERFFGDANASVARSAIPKCIHRVWLTNPNDPYEPPAHYISNLTIEAQEYSNFGWTLVLWVQDEALLPKTMAIIKQNGSLVEVKIPKNTLKIGPWIDGFDKFIIANKFPFAADILRMQILLEYGGFYADMGAKFSSRLAAEFVAQQFDYCFIFWETMFFQNSLMAMPKHSPVARYFMGLVGRPDTIPARLLEPLTGLTEGMAFSGLMITAILLSLFDDLANVCPLAPNGNIVTWEAQRSWYIDTGNNVGRHGNAYVPSTGPSFLTPDIRGKSAPNAALFGKRGKA